MSEEMKEIVEGFEREARAIERLTQKNNERLQAERDRYRKALEKVVRIYKSRDPRRNAMTLGLMVDAAAKALENDD